MLLFEDVPSQISLSLRLGVIIEATGASMYHGFLPMLVRECVTAITCAGPDGSSNTFPLYFATSLFSFLYHLATYENSESVHGGCRFVVQ